MDRIDIRILAELQQDAVMPHAAIGERINLSPSQVSRRIQRMETDGLICKRVALLNQDALGLRVEAYVTVKLASYAKHDVEAFHDRIASLAPVMECCSLTGNSDYLLHILSEDLKSFNDLISRDLLSHGDIASIQSSIILDRIKRTTALPLPKI